MARSPYRTEQQLREAMQDPRYWRAGHPEREAHVAAVTRGFQEMYSDDEASQKIVHVRAHDRTRDGRREHVDAYDQRRRGRRQRQDRPATSPSLLAPPVAANPLHSAQPSIPPTYIAFVGGAGDAGHMNVLSTRERLQIRGDLAGRGHGYYSHQDTDRLVADVQALQAGTRIVLVGHSWGGDTAARAALRLDALGRRVDLLVTIDPVSSNQPEGLFRDIRSGTGQWINVQATGGHWRDGSNLIARVGGRYGDGPASVANEHVRAPFTHRDFEAMLRVPGADGRTILSRVLTP